MAISFDCVGCGKILRARDELAGKKTRCPQCQAILRIPELPMVVVPALFDDETKPTISPDPEDDSTPYGLIEPPPRPTPIPVPAAAALEPDSTFHPTPQGGKVATRFRPITAPPTAAPSAPSQANKKGKKKRTARGDGPTTILEYSYVLFVLALIPLMVSLLRAEKEPDIQERLARTMEQMGPDERQRFEAGLAQDSIDLEQTIAAIPGNKLLGAHLARDTAMHWLYAALATAGFLGVLGICFSVERAHPIHLFGVGIFTATAGILFLLLVQFCAMIRLGSFRAGGIGLIILMIMIFIGWSYESANDPETGFLVSAFGFTFGVGLCEEFTKAIPMFFWFRRFSEVGWRGACLWGLASGVGFGVSEGIMYSSRYYNGIQGVEIYLVRFVSCVALHAMWAGSVGIAIARHVDEYEEIHDAAGFGLFAVRVMIVPMVLHGLYDTMLKKEMNGWALVIAFLSFAWLAWHIELARRARPEGGRTPVARSSFVFA